ncbi:hypothetical protein N7466_006887 [Penicillium verhagenii]|uniref:uncharacterized protein n=1 Tax=Penicillium verhagenii TaxID=1562060 RepID=UPI002545A2BD|nr:uncharacterized protein N7466_006887 [Penicillium verhagenii]KAJ5927931.1 hypothetical protein N7466_006887 [Penicillium verhagenii]
MENYKAINSDGIPHDEHPRGAGPSSQKVAILRNHTQPSYKQPGPNFIFEVKTRDVPSFKDDEVLVKILVSGVCGTDLAIAKGYLGESKEILGHEGIGYIIGCGQKVKSPYAKLSQYVGVGWLRDACGSCTPCTRDTTRCEIKVYSGVNVDGTLASYAVVPDRYITPVPDDVAPELLAPIMCAGVTAYKALKVAKVTPGSWVLISGAGGGVGMLAIAYAKAMGYRVVAVDMGSRKAGACLAGGAEAYVDCGDVKDVREEVARATQGRLCAAAIVCAGVAVAYEQAIECLDYFGTLVAVGIMPRTAKLGINPLKFIDFGIRFVGSITGDRIDVAEAVEFVRRGLVVPKVTVIGFDELGDYVKRMDEMEGKLVVRTGADE